MQLLLGLPDRQDGLVQCLQPPRLLPTPWARAPAAWDVRPPVTGPRGQGVEGESKTSRHVRGAATQGPRVVPGLGPCPTSWEPSGEANNTGSRRTGIEGTPKLSGPLISPGRQKWQGTAHAPRDGDKVGEEPAHP